MTDPYKTLGISKGATPEEIRLAFRRAAMRHHPDRGSDDPAALEKFKEAKLAYEALSRPSGRAAGGRSSTPFDDLSGFGFSGMEDVFSSIFRRPVHERGRDVTGNVDLTLEEIAKGAHRALEVQTHAGCPRCQAAGRSARCEVCHGSGQVKSVRRVEIDIPAGVLPGTQLRIVGAGAAGPAGAVAGDLYLHVQQVAHPIFERSGPDLYRSVRVRFGQAALGAPVVTQRLDGQLLQVNVPPGTRSGALLRVPGNGLPSPSGRPGDLYCRIEVEVPITLSAAQRELLEKLEATYAPPAQDQASED